MAGTQNNIELLIALGVNNDVSKENINTYIRQLKGLENVKIGLEVDGLKQSQNDFSALQNQIKLLEKEIDNLNRKLTNTSSPSGLKGVSGEFDNIKNKANSTYDVLDKFKGLDLSRPVKNLDKESINSFKSLDELYSYFDKKQIRFKIHENAKGDVTKVITQIKNELNEIETLTIKPKFNKKTEDYTFKVSSVLDDSSTSELNKNIQSSVDKLRDLATQGKLTGNEIDKYLNKLSKVTTNKEISDITKEFSHLAKETTALTSKTAALQKFNNEMEKLHRQGSISTQQKNQFIDEAKLKDNTKQIQQFQEHVKGLSSQTVDTTRMQNAMNSISDTVARLNERLSLITSKQGVSVDSSRLDSIRNKLNEISNIKINSLSDIDTLNTKIQSVERRITTLGNTSNHMERFNNTIYKAKDALGQLERSGYASEATINKLKTQLNSVESGKLDQAKNSLRAISEEMKRIGEQNKLARGVTDVNNSVARLQSDLTKTVNLYRKSVDTGQVQKLQNEINALSNVQLINPAKVDQAKREISRLREEIKQLNADATVATRNSMGFIDSFKTAMQKFPVWMAASTLFYSTVRGIKDLTDKVIELDTAMTNLRRVMDLEDYQFNQMLEKSISNVTELSGKMSEYMDVVAEYGRMGYNGDESLDLANTTQMLTNISDLNSTESVNSMVAAMIAFNMEAEDSIRIADRLNEVDNNYSITTKQLSESMNKAANVASTFGVSLDQLLGYTTAIGAATRESGNIVGNSLKTIISRMTTNNSAISALEAIGVSIKDIKGNVRPVADIIEEVAGKWDNLSDAERQNTAVKVAGVYQLTRFTALMNNHQMAIDATETSLDSYGSAMREQEKYNDSLQARINRLNTSWYGLADALGQTIIYDGIVAGTKFLELMAGGAESSSGSILTLSIALAALGAPLSLISSRMTTYTGGIIQSIAADKAKTASAGTLTASMYGLAAGTGAAATAFRSLLMVTGIGIAIAGVTAVVTLLTKSWSDNIQKQEEFAEIANKNVSALTEHKDKVEELILSYNNLSTARENGELSGEKEKEYLDVQNQLAELFPSLVAHIDSSGQAHLKSSSAVAEEVKLTKELIEAKKEEAKLLAEDTISGKQKDVGSLENDVTKYKKQIEILKKEAKKGENGNILYDAEEKYKLIAVLETKVRQTELQISGASQEMVGSILEIADAFSEIDIDGTISKEVENLVRSLDFSKMNPAQLKTFAEELGRIRDALSNSLTDGDASGFEKAKNELNELFETTNKYSPSITNLSLDFEKLTDVVENGNTVYADTSDIMSGSAEEVENLSDKLRDAKEVYEELAGVSQAFVDDSADLIYQYKMLSYQLEGYSQQQLEHIAEGQNLSSAERVVYDALMKRKEVMNALVATYPSLLSMQENSIGLTAEQIEIIKQEQKANEVLLEAYKLSAEGKLTAEQEKTLASASGTKARVEHMKSEIKFLQGYIKANTIAAQVSSIAMGMAGKLGGIAGAAANAIAEQQNAAVQNKVDGLMAELDGLMSSLNTDIGKLDNINTSVKEADKSSKSKTKTDKESIYITDKYKLALEELNAAIEKQNKLQNDYPKHSAQYRSALQNELKLQKEKLQLIQAQAKALDAQIKSGKIAQTGSVSDPKYGTTTTSKSSSAKVSGWNGSLTSKQGYRTNPVSGKSQYHNGIDLSGKMGTRLDANVSGEVIASGDAVANKYDRSYGNIVVIRDDSGNKHLYAHLEKAVAKIGSYIQAGTQVGTIGSTGNSTGPHLHYNVQDSKNNHLDAATFAKQARSGTVSVNQQVAATSTAISTTQQSIDDAKSTLLSLQTDVLNQQEKIAEIEQAIINSYFDNFEYRRNNFDDHLSHESAKLKTLTRDSDRYTKTLDLMTNYMDQKQKVNSEELTYIESLIQKGGLSAVVVDELTQRKLALKTSIHELNNEIQKFNLDRITEQYEDMYNTIDNTIEFEEARLSNLNTTSENYSKTLQTLADKYEDKYDAVLKNIKAYSSLIASGKLNGEVLKEATDKVNDLKVELQNLHNQITTKNYELVVNIKTKYDEQIDDKQFELDYSKKVQSKYEEGTANFNDETKKQISIYEEMAKMYDQSRRKIQEEMKQKKLTAEQVKDLTEQMEDLSLSYMDAITSIDSLNKSLEDSRKQMLNDIADAYINAYKEYVQERQDEHMKMLDDELEREQERHDKIMKQYQEEMDLFRKNVQEKLDLIDRQEAQRSYDMDMDDLEKERKEIVDKINLLSIDDSYEAKKKRTDLLKQLDEKDKEITEKKHARDIELQKEALNDLVEMKEEEIGQKEELEDEQYNKVVESIDRQKEYWQKHYTDLLNDERKFAQIREDILNGHFDKVNAEFQQYINEMIATMPQLEDTMDGTMQAVGTSIRQNIIDNLREAMKLVEEYQAKQDSSSPINKDKWQDDFNPNLPKEDLGEGNLIESMGDVKVVVGKYMTDILSKTESNPVRRQNIVGKAHDLAAEGRAEGSSIPQFQHVDKALSGFSDTDKEKIKQYVSANANNIFITDYLQRALRGWAASLDTGGFMNWSGAGIDGKGGKAIIAHPNEVMLNEVQTDRLLDNIQVSDRLTSGLASIMNTFSSLAKGMSPTFSFGGGQGDVQVTLTGNIYTESKNSAENWATQLGNAMRTNKGGW